MDEKSSRILFVSRGRETKSSRRLRPARRTKIIRDLIFISRGAKTNQVASPGTPAGEKSATRSTDACLPAGLSQGFPIGLVMDLFGFERGAAGPCEKYNKSQAGPSPACEKRSSRRWAQPGLRKKSSRKPWAAQHVQIICDLIFISANERVGCFFRNDPGSLVGAGLGWRQV